MTMSLTVKPLEYSDIHNLVLSLQIQIEARVSNDEFRTALISSHNALCALAKYL
jgi:hypothetical protein